MTPEERADAAALKLMRENFFFGRKDLADAIADAIRAAVEEEREIVAPADKAERMAWFVYEAARLENAAAGRPINPERWEDRDAAFREDMIRAVSRQCGPDRLEDPEALHDAWVQAYEKIGWKYGPIRDIEKREHPDMVPFDDLYRLEQEKDWAFFMFCEIAAAIRSEPPCSEEER